MSKNYFQAIAVAFVFVLSFVFTASAQTSPDHFPNIKIINFGQMDKRFFRGAQPLPDDYQSLKDFGIQTVIDLRNDPTDYEKSAVEALGMKYVNIPMSGWKYPKAEYIEEFLKLVNDSETGNFFVHCKAGIHRTGIVGAVYRFTKYDWGYEQSYKEMKNYNFSSGLVHGRLKTFVKDYAEKMEIEKAKLPVGQNTAQTSQ